MQFIADSLNSRLYPVKAIPSAAVSANAKKFTFPAELLGTNRAITLETEQNLLKIDNG
jgi:hypothetical protein